MGIFRYAHHHHRFPFATVLLLLGMACFEAYASHPRVSITSPAPGATVTGTITVTASASDNRGVAGVQFKYDGIDIGPEDTVAPYAIAADTTAVPNGTYTLTAVARDFAGNRTTSAPVTVVVANGSAPNGSAPYSGSPITLPATFEAENFDLGGNGVAYRDNTAGNQGAQYRPGEDVDIFVSDDPAGGGYIIKNFEIGEWLAYTISVPASGNYDIDLRAVTNAAFPDAAFHVEIDGVNVTGTVVLPTTDTVGWSSYQWIGKKTVALSAGTHVLKLVSEQQYFGLNQIRIAGSSAPASSASLLFRSGYEGATVLNLPTNCYGTGCWQALAGVDTSSGFAWPPLIWGGGANFQLLVDATVDASTVDDYMTNQIQTVTGRDGAPTQALYSAITQSGCCGIGPQGGGATQNPYILQPASEGGDLYIRYWLKYQPDFAAVMAGASGWNWRSVFEWKTAGDYRVVAAIKRDPYLNGGQTFWSVWGDNNANGGLPYEKFWEVQNMSVPVPVDQWFKVEVFWHRSSGADGRVWMAMNGQVICDRRGPNIGVNNARINRIFTHLLYSSTTYPIYQWVDDLEIWDGFPSDASSH